MIIKLLTLLVILQESILQILMGTVYQKGIMGLRTEEGNDMKSNTNP